jgi:hypothetical protein
LKAGKWGGVASNIDNGMRKAGKCGGVALLTVGTLGGVASTIENGELTTRKRGAYDEKTGRRSIIKADCSRPGNGKV